MLRIVLFITFFFSQVSYAVDRDFSRSIITDPSISRRCDALIETRNHKLGYKQKIQALLKRCERLLKMAPPEKRTLVKKLKQTRDHLDQELQLAVDKPQNQEEDIIRKGCPGISL